MSYWKIKLMKFIKIYNLILLILFILSSFSFHAYAKNFIIEGNQFTDDTILLSIIDELPDTDEKSQSDYILKKLVNSGFFKSVEVLYDDDNFAINVVEHPSINRFVYIDNLRIKDEEIDNIINELDIFTLSESKINNLIEELRKIYQSFGYNNIKIDFTYEIFENNSSDVFLEFDEGQITKIKNIYFKGNSSYENDIILSKIKSKSKKITNIFANNNLKIFEIKNDLIRIKNFYRSKGYRDVNVNYTVEYFENNKVDVNFNINEGEQYFFSKFNIKNNLDNNNNVNEKLNILVDQKLNKFKYNEVYSTDKLINFELEVSKILDDAGIQYYKISTLEKIKDFKADILIDISPTKPFYVNQINILGNDRTYDYVFRREIDLYEGDPVNDTKLKKIERKLNRLRFISEVEVKTVPVNETSQNIEIIVNEAQTGSFNVGLSVGTLDGASFVSGLKENNINGTGRTLEFLVNTSEDNREFTLATEDKFFINNEINHGYSLKYKENDFSKYKSYKVNTFNFNTNFKYSLTENTQHNIGFGYSIKDYTVTDSSTVSSNIAKSEGENVSFNLSNDLTRNTLNSFIRPTNGDLIAFNNYIETPSSSVNGFVKNLIIAKKYYDLNNNIFSVQGRVGNIISLNDSEILSDDKFALGGRLLRGFDNFGAGPRNSRTDYVGGNNLFSLKLDYSKPITLNEQNPIYLNLFNDYGSVWGNKNSVTSSDQDLRASYGFGFNYYSPIGPIGFAWGFPLVDKDYDIKRMFLFSIGNLN